ncbi:MAG: hypothetical protein Q8N96_08425 [Methylovulum sp.]|nr:hypothetical protein [Methylovulum sp.]
MKRLLVSLVLLWLSIGMLYADEIRMPENAPRPIKIGVAVFVNSITKVNDQANTFEGSLDLQLRWKNTDLAFDPRERGTNRMEYNRDAAIKKLASIWTPGLSLANAAMQNIEIEKGLFIYADGTVVLILRVNGVFGTKYRLEAFPFDTQALTVRIVSEKYNTNQITLTQDQRDINDSGLSKAVRLSAWQPKRLAFAESRTRGWNGQYFPEMQAQIMLARLPSIHLLAILMPFFLVMLIPTIGTLYTKLDLEKRLGFWSASILALVALSFTYTARYPMLPSHSIIVQLIVIGSGYQTIMILLTVTLFNPQNTDRWFSNKFIVPEMTNYLRWAIPLALIGLVLTRIMLTSLIMEA